MSLVSRLALTMEDRRWRNDETSVRPDWKSRMSADAKQLTEEEKERVERTCYDAKFSGMVLLDNFDARQGLFLPITGYAAVWHTNVNFNAHVFDRNLFRGVAWIATNLRKEPSNYAHVCSDLNSVFGDCSPIPATRDGSDAFVTSLGSFAWIGLYHSSTHAKNGLVAAVVSGLDDAEWRACSVELNIMHGTVSVNEAHARIGFWRDIARRRRERSLSTFMRVLGTEPYLKSGKKIVENRAVLYPARATSRIELPQGWFDRGLVPEWFVFPSRAPSLCTSLPTDVERLTGVITDTPARRETSPIDVVPDGDVIIDDLAFLRFDEFVRLAGCGATTAEHFARVYGPTDVLYVGKNINHSDINKYDAVAAQATQRVSVLESEVHADVTVTWEDATLSRNRNLDSTYAFRTSKEDDEGEAVTVLTPYFVRVSCTDSTGRARPEKELVGKRLAGLSLDDYVPIGR